MKQKKLRLVVIDDEAALLELYETLLTEVYEILTYSHPKKFLEDLEIDSFATPDLLITDFKMPAMSGLEMIRRAYNLNHYFPFILLTGFLDKQTAVDAVDLGAFRLLEKPVDFNILSETIEQLMMENDVTTNRREIRKITGQLRELYSNFRLLFEQYIPNDVLGRMILETDSSGGVKTKVNFEILLKDLEGRLEKLLDAEKVYEELKLGKMKR